MTRRLPGGPTPPGPTPSSGAEAPSVWRMVFDAATEPFIILLLVAGLGAVALNEVRDGILILIGLVPIVGADVVTEFRGERALEALRDASAPTARVRRAGRILEIPAASLVAGDVVVIRVGDVVPADLRITAHGSPERRSERTDRRIRSGAGQPGAGPGGCRTRQPALHGVLRDQRRRRSRRGDRGRHRRRDGGRTDRRRPGNPAAPKVAAPARARSPGQDPDRRRHGPDRDHHGAGLPARQPGRREPARRHLGGDRRNPRGAADPARRGARARSLSTAQARCPRPAAERRGGPGGGGSRRDRQDRDAHPESARGRLGHRDQGSGRRCRPAGAADRCAAGGGRRVAGRGGSRHQLLHPGACPRRGGRRRQSDAEPG